MFALRTLAAVSLAALALAACAKPQQEASMANTGGQATAPAMTTEMGRPDPGSQEDLVVNVGDRVFFGFDRYDLSDDAQAVLVRQAAWLKQYPANKLIIEGHADERGTREYNLALGERRAAASKNFLLAQGVAADRLETISYGKERPAVLGTGEAVWSQNRRAVSLVAN
jgi:peptidoglycan-associated lipoprotein